MHMLQITTKLYARAAWRIPTGQSVNPTAWNNDDGSRGDDDSARSNDDCGWACDAACSVNTGGAVDCGACLRRRQSNEAGNQHCGDYQMFHLMFLDVRLGVDRGDRVSARNMGPFGPPRMKTTYTSVAAARSPANRC
jgi:hypothetical protein